MMFMKLDTTGTVISLMLAVVEAALQEFMQFSSSADVDGAA